MTTTRVFSKLDKDNVLVQNAIKDRYNIVFKKLEIPDLNQDSLINLLEDLKFIDIKAGDLILLITTQEDVLLEHYCIYSFWKRFQETTSIFIYRDNCCYQILHPLNLGNQQDERGMALYNYKCSGNCSSCH
jgi:hypothetical protein